MKKIIFALISSLLCSSVFAVEPLWPHNGPYLEANFGTNLYYVGAFTSEGSVTGGGVEGLGWSGALGYQFNKTFGLEAGFMQSFSKNINSDNKNQLNIPYASTRFTVPISERFSFIGKLGVMYAMLPHEGGMLLPYTGIGFGYAANSNLDITTQYQGAIYGIGGAGLVSLGLTYHF